MRIVFFIMISFSLSLSSDVLIDSRTGLMWQDNSTAKNTKKDWQGAVDFCSALRLAGHDDWRLPIVKELESVIDLSSGKPAMKNGFKNVGASGYYWSSSEHASSKEFAWMMNFKRGYEYSNYKTYARYVRCVRGKQ